MLIDREKLIKHLNRIYCNGQIGELVLQPDFSARAITVDQTLLVVAPELEGVEPLSAEVGVMDLKLLIRSLDGLGSDDPQVSLEFTGNRILIEEKHRGRLRLVTGSPKVIGTQVSDEIFAAIEGEMPEMGHDEGIPLPQSVIQGVLDSQGLLGADMITLKTGPKGSLFQVGEETGHYAEIEIPLLEVKKAYKLIFRSSVLTDALRQVDDFTQTFLSLTGPDSMVALDTAWYRYIISPDDK